MKQGIWTAPAEVQRGGGEEGSRCVGSMTQGRPHPGTGVWEKPGVPDPGHEVRAWVKRVEGCHRPW